MLELLRLKINRSQVEKTWVLVKKLLLDIPPPFLLLQVAKSHLKFDLRLAGQVITWNTVALLHQNDHFYCDDDNSRYANTSLDEAKLIGSPTTISMVISFRSRLNIPSVDGRLVSSGMLVGWPCCWLAGFCWLHEYSYDNSINRGYKLWKESEWEGEAKMRRDFINKSELGQEKAMWVTCLQSLTKLAWIEEMSEWVSAAREEIYTKRTHMELKRRLRSVLGHRNPMPNGEC